MQSVHLEQTDQTTFYKNKHMLYASLASWLCHIQFDE